MRNVLKTVLLGALAMVVFGAFGAAVGHVLQNFLNAYLFDTPVDGMEFVFGILAAGCATFKYAKNERRRKEDGARAAMEKGFERVRERG